jgi:hypothetical protein
MKINQILPTFSPVDAIGNWIVEINEALKKIY